MLLQIPVMDPLAKRDTVETMQLSLTVLRE